MLSYVFVDKLMDCPTKKSDNGLYLISGKWNTLFHRWRKNVDGEISIT
ncbi:MAG TPA: hypothetical protein PKD70_06330 [Saprospiraceae bacterium]|nr:hypothetical protein [Saprospiraceae bacterium]HMP13475.1 hypothetical protein [Saprospiraceae bacterium]